MDITEQRAWLSKDFNRYLTYAATRDGHVIQAFQRILADWLQGKRVQWRARKKAMLGFRGSAKTWLLRRYVEWRWLRVPDLQVVYHSSTDPLASQFIVAIQAMMESDPAMSHLEIGVGGTMAFSIKGHEPEKGHSIRSAGIKTSITGQRADLYIFDDPEPDVDPEGMYDRILQAFEEAEMILHPTDRMWRHAPEVPVPERTNLVVAGQPHWTGTAYIPREDDAITGEEQAHALKDALFLKIPCLRRVPIGTPGSVIHPDMLYSEMSMMPSRFPTDRLLKMRDNKLISTSRWRLQMMIDTSPIEGEGSVIPFSRLPQMSVELSELTGLTAVIDPADSENGCEWGIAIGGIYRNMIHVVDLLGIYAPILTEEEGEAPGLKIWNEIFDACEELGVRRICLEKNLRAPKIAARRVLRTRKLRAEVSEYTASVNKLVRIIEALEHPCQVGMISFEPHVLRDMATARQLSQLRHTKLPKPADRIDALAGLVNVLRESSALHGSGDPAIMRRTGDTRPSSFSRIEASNAFKRLRTMGN